MSTNKLNLHWYVYVLSRPTGEPFYIGKGQGTRMYHHETAARKGESSEKSHIIRKIEAGGGRISKEIVARFATDQESRVFEIAEIARLGRKDLGLGPLVNRTDGGDGNDIRSWTPEMREHHRQRTREGMAKPEIREACRAHVAAQRADPRMRERLVGPLKTHWANPENRAAQSERTSRFVRENPEAHEANAQKRRESLATPEVRARMSAGRRLGHQMRLMAEALL